MRGWKAVAAASVLLTLVTFAMPRRAHAGNSLTNGLIIGGITAGVVATVIIVAILIEGNKEPEPELMGFARLDAARPPRAGARVACLQPDGTRALLCW